MATIYYSFKVLDSLDNPIAGANVHFAAGAGATWSGTSNANGVVSGSQAVYQMPADVTLIITAAGFKQATLQSAVVTDPDHPPPDMRLALVDVNLVEGS